MNLSKFVELTRFEYIFFGLPFVLSGALLPILTEGFAPSWVLMWILPAFLTARISGMAFNQLIDRHIDAKNMRTQKRCLPTGRVTANEARVVAWVALGGFLLVCAQINIFCLLVSPLVAFLLFIYSYMKRIHASCHFVLGMIHFLSPVMAYGAITDRLSLSSALLGLVALLSITGNDIIYAIQDYDFDVAQHLHSLPAKLGCKKSLIVAGTLHALCVGALIAFGKVAYLGGVFFLAPALVAVLLLIFHRRIELKGKLFSLCNVLVASTVFIFIILSKIGFLWRAI